MSISGLPFFAVHRTIKKQHIYERKEENAMQKENDSASVSTIDVNPCYFRIGGLEVKLEFTAGAPSLQDCLTGFLLRKKNGLQ